MYVYLTPTLGGVQEGVKTSKRWKKSWQQNESDPEQNSALPKLINTKINCYLLDTSSI